MSPTAKIDSRLQGRIDEGWKFRLNREIEKAMAVCVQLKQSVRLPAGDFQVNDLRASLRAGTHPQALTGVSALYCSLVRALRGTTPAQKLLTELDAFCWENDCLDHFYQHFEGAMVLFSKGEYAEALERFFSAVAHAHSPWQKMCGGLNATLCLENLGLPFDGAMGETVAAIQECEKGSLRSTAENHIRALEMRKEFRAGEISRAIALGAKPDPSRAHYYSLWLRSLPYHKGFRPPVHSDLPLFHTSRFFHKDYRLRSLLGIGHPGDWQEGFNFEFADRLYLWVWKWLQDPQSFPVQKIVQQLRYLDLSSQVHRMTAEDVFLTRNALLWLGLFDLKNDESLRGLVRSLPSFPEEGFSIFELESLVIHCARAVRDSSQREAKETLELIRNHPLAQSRDLYLVPLAESLFDVTKEPSPPLRAVSAHLRSLLPVQAQVAADRIRVDLALGMVQVPGQKPILSQSMASGLELLRAHGVVTVEEFSGVCFGIRSFNPLVHMPRIYNLMARLKALSIPGFRVRVNQGRILCEADWKRFEFVRDSQCVRQLSKEPDWVYFTLQQAGQTSPMESASESSEIRWNGLATREQIQSLVKKPRSTTNRILKRWIAEGRVVREGQARSCRYRLKKLEDLQMEDPK